MDIRIDERLWATSMAPEGVLERWRAADGGAVSNGQTVAEVSIEGCRHEIVATATGRLRQLIAAGDVIEPGTLIAAVAADAP